MDPQDQPVRRRKRAGLLAGVLATGALGAFAVGAIADDRGQSDTGRAADGGAAPSFVQDQQRDRDGRDCPWRDGGDRQQAPERSPNTGSDVQL